MEKTQIHFSASSILSSFRTMTGHTMSSNTVWHIIMGTVFCALLAISALTYATYLWAIDTEVPQVVTKRDRDAFSLVEIKKTIALYQKKEETYEALLRESPDAPPYAKGKGVVVTPLAVPAVVTQDTSVATGTIEQKPEGGATLLPG